MPRSRSRSRKSESVKSVEKVKETNVKENVREINSYLAARTYDLIKPGTLTIAVYAHFYPVAYKDSNNHLAGLDVDILSAFAKAVNLKVVFIERKKFHKIWRETAKARADVAIGGIGMMPNRLDSRIEWTMPYFHVMRTVVYNKKDPIKNFPQDVHRTVLGTFGSTGWLDAELRAKPLHKEHFMVRGTTDEDDIKRVKTGDVQGIMRGSFVGQSIVHRFPDLLAMAKPWHIEPSLVTSDGEIFAFPTRLGSGLAAALSSFLTEMHFSGALDHLLKKYHLT